MVVQRLHTAQGVGSSPTVTTKTVPQTLVIDSAPSGVIYNAAMA